MYCYRSTYSAFALALALSLTYAEVGIASPADEDKPRAMDVAVTIGDLSAADATAFVATERRIVRVEIQEDEGSSPLLAVNGTPALRPRSANTTVRSSSMSSSLLATATNGNATTLQAVLVGDPFPSPLGVAALALGGFLFAGIGVVIRDAFKNRSDTLV